MDNLNQEIIFQLREFAIGWMYIEREYWWVFGLVAGFGLLTIIFNIKNRFRYVGMMVFLAASTLQLVPYFFGEQIILELFNRRYAFVDKHLYAFLIGLPIGAILCLFLHQAFDRIRDYLKRFFKSSTPFNRNSMTDIRCIDGQLPKTFKEYSLNKYIKKNRIFLGLDERKNAKFIDSSLSRTSHFQIVGTTGSGKGVLSGSLLTQSIANGECVICFSPKDDEWMPYVLGQAAEDKNRPYYYIDLIGNLPQINPLSNYSYHNICEFLSSAFGTSEKGTDADFYRLADRSAIKQFARFYLEKELSFKQAVVQFISDNDQLSKEAPKFREDLLELVDLPVTHAISGLDISKAVEEGAVIYIQGSMRHEGVLKLQKALLTKMIHICENRKRETARQVCLFLDEFKYLIAKPSLEALGAIRDKKAHVILTHQSLGDLKDCPADISPESVVASVNENCAIKIVYKVRDPETAKWFSDMSGSILVDNEIREFELKPSLAEVNANVRRLTQSERPLIDTNMMMSLPPRCAAVFGDGLASMVFTSPVKVTKDERWVTPSRFDSVAKIETGVDKPLDLSEELINVN